MSGSDREAVELALSSPDPTIRSVAMRRKAIEPEIAQLDGFLAMYKNLHADPGAAASPPRPDPRPAPPPLGDFVGMVRATLREAGRPLALGALFDAYWARQPEQTPTTKDAFRRRLVTAKDQVACTDGTYWPEGEAVPVATQRAQRVNGDAGHA
jgi:hypothetical protein